MRDDERGFAITTLLGLMFVIFAYCVISGDQAELAFIYASYSVSIAYVAKDIILVVLDK